MKKSYEIKTKEEAKNFLNELLFQNSYSYNSKNKLEIIPNNVINNLIKNKEEIRSILIEFFDMTIE
jgi:chemotaxis methyl-accepting protein methylase